MPIEEQAEEKIQNIVQTIITGGARLGLRITKDVAMALLRTGAKTGAKLVKAGTHAADEAVKDRINSGEMSEKRLQKKKDGDLHELQLDDSTMREVQRSLKTAGIDYHFERTDQSQFILHFAGRDEDHIRAAVQRAFRNMGLDIADEDFAVEQQTEQQERTTEQTRSEPEPAPDEARTPATRQQTQARADNPRPAGKEQKPKPIRSKKALLERFKTRLNENLAEQKNHMPPTQNRDRTPRKSR